MRAVVIALVCGVMPWCYRERSLEARVAELGDDAKEQEAKIKRQTDDAKEREAKIQRQDQMMGDMACDQQESEQVVVVLRGNIHTLEEENENLEADIGEMGELMEATTAQLNAVTADRNELDEQLVAAQQEVTNHEDMVQEITSLEESLNTYEELYGPLNRAPMMGDAMSDAEREESEVVIGEERDAKMEAEVMSPHCVPLCSLAVSCVTRYLCRYWSFGGNSRMHCANATPSEL